jgi:hypothetical protein
MLGLVSMVRGAAMRQRWRWRVVSRRLSRISTGRTDRGDDSAPPFRSRARARVRRGPARRGRRANRCGTAARERGPSATGGRIGEHARVDAPPDPDRPPGHALREARAAERSATARSASAIIWSVTALGLAAKIASFTRSDREPRRAGQIGARRREIDGEGDALGLTSYWVRPTVAV